MRYRVPHPFAPPRPGGSTLEELVDRHAHLVAVGLANCRAAQSLKREINRRELERRNAQLETPPAVPKRSEGGNHKPETLSNDDNHYNPDELRDKKTGRWMTFGDLLPPEIKRVLAYRPVGAKKDGRSHYACKNSSENQIRILPVIPGC